MDQIHRLIIKRLEKRVYDQPLINNVERGAYIEHMIELALGEPWCLTWPWASWDLQHEETLARIEIKQSAARQPWHRRRPPESPATRGSFGILELHRVVDGNRLHRPGSRRRCGWHTPVASILEPVAFILKTERRGSTPTPGWLQRKAQPPEWTGSIPRWPLRAARAARRSEVGALRRRAITSVRSPSLAKALAL